MLSGSKYSLNEGPGLVSDPRFAVCSSTRFVEAILPSHAPYLFFLSFYSAIHSLADQFRFCPQWCPIQQWPHMSAWACQCTSGPIVCSNTFLSNFSHFTSWLPVHCYWEWFHSQCFLCFLMLCIGCHVGAVSIGSAFTGSTSSMHGSHLEHCLSWLAVCAAASLNIVLCNGFTAEPPSAD